MQVCDFDSCEEYADERKNLLVLLRRLFDQFETSIFTSGIRLGIVLTLFKMESACVCEIQFALNESRQPLVSHHLRQLKKAGWITREKWKRWTFYKLVDDRRSSLSILLEGMAE